MKVGDEHISLEILLINQETYPGSLKLVSMSNSLSKLAVYTSR